MLVLLTKPTDDACSRCSVKSISQKPSTRYPGVSTHFITSTLSSFLSRSWTDGRSFLRFEMPNAFGYTAASTSGYQKSSRKRFRSIAMRNNVLPLVIVIQATFISVLLISHRSDSSMLRRARLEDLNNNARPLRYAVQQEPPSEHVAVTHHAQPLALAEDTSQHDANSAHIPEAPPVEARDVTHAGLRMNPSKEVAPVQHNENEPASDKPKRELPVPDECAVWKSVAKDTSKLRLYRKHFVSHDLSKCSRNALSIVMTIMIPDQISRVR